MALSGQGFHPPGNDKNDKNDIVPRHKVIHFGDTLKAESPAEEKLYWYKHQRADFKVSKGSIPVGFLASVDTFEGQPIFLETRDGGFNERNLPVGPQYKISWKVEREVVGAQPGGDGWNASLDDLWRDVLAHFERKNLLSEDSLVYLDADPFVLFGIDDPITQQALVKLATFPALHCDGATPDLNEWAAYLRIDPADSSMQWLVQAFAETDLPKPWTCYKGVGSIVCYIRSDTGQVTWKHPFYDYFRQLREFCLQATTDEVMKVRCNRLLWSYEATRVETEHDQEPLISPEYIRKLSDIFGYNIETNGCLVRNLKAQMKVFAKTYRAKQDVDIEDVMHCAKLLERDLQKYQMMKDHWQNKAQEDMQFELTKLANGELECVECQAVALSFCLECKDYLCLNCYDALHSKGARMHHSPFRLVACTLCSVLPAKLHCTFTDKSLCHRCYAMRHIKMLPPDGKENQPRRIDYKQQYDIYKEKAQDRAKEKRKAQEAKLPALGNLEMLSIKDDAYESVLSTDWHPFYDPRGVKYYYNFTTSERMRQSPRHVPNINDPGAEEVPAELERTTSHSGSPFHSVEAASLPGSVRSPTGARMYGQFSRLNGFDSSKIPEPDLRALRPPHRTHMPHEVPAM